MKSDCSNQTFEQIILCMNKMIANTKMKNDGEKETRLSKSQNINISSLVIEVR